MRGKANKKARCFKDETIVTMVPYNSAFNVVNESSGRNTANIHITALLSILLDYCKLIILLIFLRLDTVLSASLATCKCVQYNTSGTFHSPNFPLVPFSLTNDNSCYLYRFIAPDDSIVAATFDFFQLQSKSDRSVFFNTVIYTFLL